MATPFDSNANAASSGSYYRALCPTAVMSVVVGAISLLTSLSWYLAVVPLLGIWLGWKAKRTIENAPGEWTGMGIAWLGIGLSTAMWILGYGWLILANTSEKPYGYEWITYEMLQPDPNVPTESIPQSAIDMQDKRVYVKGFMQPRRQQTGIKEFILTPTSGECQFCNPNPKTTEKMRIVLQGDLETVFTTHQIGVGGRFQVDPRDPDGIPYTIEADYLR